MKRLQYQEPDIFLIPDLGFIALAQSGGDLVPSNPEFTCDGSQTECYDEQDNFPQRQLEVLLRWNDDPGSNVDGYVVNISLSIDGDSYDLSTSYPSCSINEISSGLYELECDNITLTGSGCQCSSVITINSITDPDGHVLNSTVSCDQNGPGGC